jgi:hypothetical protein
MQPARTPPPEMEISPVPMSKLLEKAFRETLKPPEKEQDNIAELVISFIHPDEAEEAEWDTLVRSPSGFWIRW